MTLMETNYKQHRKISFNHAKCNLAFGFYYDGRPKLVLKEVRTNELIAVATVNLAKDNVHYSKLNDDIIVKSWGVNEGLYEILKENNIISKKIGTLQVGPNEAYLCKLLVNPDYYEKI